MDADERRARAGTDAAEWWLRLQSGEMSRSEREQFVTWLRESAIHVAELLRIAQLHDSLEQFESWANISVEGAANETIVDFPTHPANLSTTVVRKSSRVGLRRAIAASALLIGLAAAVLFAKLGSQTIETDRGERRQVALSDGSVLQVDPETKMRVTLDARERRIVLQQGRALFRVARDQNRPFSVVADQAIIRAIGTSFAVERKSQGITVTVAEGKVAVSTAREPGLSEPSPVLTANEQVTVKASGASQAILKVDSHRELAWTEGRLIFDSATVAGAVADFNRYNRMQLHVADRSLASRPVSGVFDASDPESFIAFIQTTTDVTVTRDHGHNITITSANPK